MSLQPSVVVEPVQVQQRQPRRLNRGEAADRKVVLGFGTIGSVLGTV